MSAVSAVSSAGCSRAITAAALWLVAACGAAPGASGPSAVTASDAIVHVTSNVGDAQLFIDGRLLAPLSALRGGVAIAPGLHRLELRHEDYFSSYLEITLARAARTSIDIQMSAVLP